jgi:hypothetical protein
MTCIMGLGEQQKFYKNFEGKQDDPYGKGD